MWPFDALGGWFAGEGAASGRRSTDGGTDPAAPADLGPQEFRRRADETADAWPELELDFTLPSLERLDEVAAERGGVFEDPLDPEDGLPTMTGGEYLLDFGSYCGEVLANNFDGEWVEAERTATDASGTSSDSGSAGSWAVSVPVGTGDASVGVFDVAARSFVDEPVFDQVVEMVREGQAGALGSPGVAAGAQRELGARADAFVDDRPDAGLDYTPASLLRLDELAAAVDGDEAPDGFGAYLGEVFVRRYGGEWCWSAAAGWVVALRGPAGEQTLDVRGTLRDRLAEATTFAAAHDDLLAATGVDGPELAVVAVAERYREAAEGLAAERDGLDFSVPSLARLDRLAAEQSDGEADLLDAALGESGDAGGRDADPAERFAGYFAEVLRRNHSAAWHLDGDGGELVVRGDGPTAELEPTRVAEAALADEATFVDVYARLAERIGLSPPLEEC